MTSGYDKWIPFEMCLAAKQEAERQRVQAEKVMTQLSMKHVGDTLIISQELIDIFHRAAVALRRIEGKTY